MTDAVFYRSGSPAGEIVLHQPARRNALNEAMWLALPGLIAEAEADTQAKVIILRGSGGHFAAGADISEFETVYATRERAALYSSAISQGLSSIAACAKPTLALIEGACIGGGCSIALACDFRFAVDSARFGVTPGKLGLVYPLADTRRLIRTVGLSRAKDILFTGRIFSAPEALVWGLVDRLDEIGNLEAEAMRLINDIARTSQWSVRATKRMIALMEEGASDDDAAAEALFLDSFSGEDFKEGYRAFLDKQSPDFPFK
jgi:enoyl-CoA hydratase/carnithine racemase